MKEEEKISDEEPSSKIEKEEKKVSKKNIKKKKQAWWIWPLKILVLTLVLSFSFSVLSELVLSSAGIVISIFIIIALLVLAVLFDMIGVAAASCSLDPFTAMSSRKVRGAKEAIFIVKKADRIASICNDVIGDICGIISGAAGATIVASILVNSNSSSYNILIAAGMSALIAGLTVFGKAMGKKYAITKSTNIILFVGKVLSLFTRPIKKKKSNTSESKIDK